MNRERLLVAAVEESVDISAQTDCIVLPDPCNGQDRTYLSTKAGIVEVHAIDSDYSSFLVDSNVISDGKLYTLTPVDPLYWFLTVSQDLPSSWQPLDQILAQSSVIKEHLESQQLVAHMLERMDISEDENFYKFSTDKALKWLSERQSRVEKVLQTQYLRDMQESRRASAGGAFSESFCREDKEKSGSPKSVLEEVPLALDETATRSAREESIQAVCNYLNDDWTKKFLDFLKEEPKVLEQPKKDKKILGPANGSVADWNMSLVSGTGSSSCSGSSATKIQSNQTAGNKRLAKVDRKGMKKMSSFFGVKKAKKK